MINLFRRKPAAAMPPPVAELAAPVPPAEHSRDIFDYLADVPGLPSRADRDHLVQQALTDPTKEKRVRIWDYFFPIDQEYIGKPQLREIEDLENKRNTNLRRMQNRFTSFMAYSLGVLIASIFLYFQKFIAIAAQWSWVGIVIGIVGALASVGWYYSQKNRVAHRIEQKIALLRQSIQALKTLAPALPSDTEINDWLEEDIHHLGNEALRKTFVGTPLDENFVPLHILAYAKLQDPLKIRKCLPDLIGKPDLEKHLEAIKSGSILDEKFDIFYGIYYFEFFILRDKILANFGCFYDFITGRIYGEHTKEMYYNDIVALTIRQEYQEPRLTWLALPRITLSTFSLSLKSGERIEVTLPSEEYLEQYALLHNQRLFLPEKWARNPENIAQEVAGALRRVVFPHKP